MTLQRFDGTLEYAIDTTTKLIHLVSINNNTTPSTVTDIGAVVYSTSGGGASETNYSLETGGNLATISSTLSTINGKTGVAITPTQTLAAVGILTLTGSAQQLVTTPTSGCTGVWLQPPMNTDGSPANQQTVYWGNSTSQVFGMTTSNGGTFIKVANPSVLYVKGRNGDTINWAIIQ